MCCFSRPVRRVEATRIYARADGARQLVVYEMKLDADGDLAMVLPIPVAPGSGERAISFVDLSSSPAFFAALDYAFRAHTVEPQALSRGPSKGGVLAVERVGAFDASFVPRAEDFDRLDPRFALPSSLWAQIPSVAGFGFVVFALRGPTRSLGERLFGASRPGPRAVHPMAFWFPRADTERVFFPTLHVHDGEAHARAEFDHALYAQSADTPAGWERSPHDFHAGMAGVGRDLVLPRPGARLTIRGEQPNDDVWIAG